MNLKLTSMPRLYRYNECVDWFDALEWFCREFKEFPEEITNGFSDDMGRDIYKNWRLVRCIPDNEIVFGNMILPGVTEQMFYEYKNKMKIEVL